MEGPKHSREDRKGTKAERQKQTLTAIISRGIECSIESEKRE